MPEIDAFILIGGRSSRLGTDKAFVELGGRTLLGRAVETAKNAVGPKRITAVAANATQFAINAIIADVPFIFDLHENRGPLGGLHAALAYAKAPWIFLLACDYPFVAPELISLLAERITDDAISVVPEQDDGRLQPLCAFYRVDEARPIVEEMIERPRVPPPMQEIVQRMNPLVVRFEEYSKLPASNRFFLNINTPHDLERARSEIG